MSQKGDQLFDEFVESRKIKKIAKDIWLDTVHGFGVSPKCNIVRYEDDTFAWVEVGSPPSLQPYYDMSYTRKELETSSHAPITRVSNGDHGEPDLSKEFGNWISWKIAPKNNDGRTDCFVCHWTLKSVGWGQYQICENKECKWFDR